MTHETIWKTLSSIDVNTKTEKKGNLTYLSWAWAWRELMNHFPMASYTFTEWEYPDGTHKDILIYPDDTCSVECELRIGDHSHKMWLPVMDYKNQAIVNPNARAISDTKMRCLVKCIAMFGLGCYIYAGEDLPSSDSSPPSSNETAPHKRGKRKLSKIQQEQVEKIRTIATTHTVFTNSNGGTDLQKQVLGVVDGDPTPAEIDEWLSFVVSESNLYDNEQKDKEHQDGR